ncbi:hypothetical protein HT746_05275 [Burkholderia pyrrocinia]|uniref:hypothetical protein n=1 Tax=Burkholderia pyrrocinia TaxID=60550 RepID=UPI001576E4C1|nr:hypothetical protein [Burkholderia pyrrocinia]NTX26553.1 hypothetical protein [Burkholderia pyrrocinia]
MNRHLCSVVFLSIGVISTLGIKGEAHAVEITLCQSHEEIYFSCSLGGKIISLCASGNVSPNNGYVQYRYGVLDHIEIQFPNKPYPPNARFEISDISAGNLNYVHIKFKSGKYDYVIYQGSPSGVYIKKRGNLISNKICEQGEYRQLNQRIFRGIKTGPPVDGVDN